MVRRAFTIVEVLVVVAIVALLAALLYPVYAQAKRSAKRAVCISNLRQIGEVIQQYRADWGGSEEGGPSAMGLPLGSALWFAPGVPNLKCTGDAGAEPAGYHMNYPAADGSKDGTEEGAGWAHYVAKYGSASILIFDPNHQPVRQVSLLENWTALGLRLDGGVIVRVHRGPVSSRWEWWHD